MTRIILLVSAKPVRLVAEAGFVSTGERGKAGCSSRLSAGPDQCLLCLRVLELQGEASCDGRSRRRQSVSQRFAIEVRMRAMGSVELGTSQSGAITAFGPYSVSP